MRAIKNRFGAVNEIGVFAMTERGLKGVANPSAIFLSTHGEPVPGSCVLVTLEGTRPLLVEIQALVDSGGPSPRRLSVGLDRDRLAMLLAVLHRHAGVSCMDQDVFVNAVGGVRISEPAADLAVLLAIQGSLRGKPLPRGFIAFGEVGLAGEVRPAPRGQERLKEAAKLGFSVARGAQGERAEEADRGADRARGRPHRAGHRRGARAVSAWPDAMTVPTMASWSRPTTTGARSTSPCWLTLPARQPDELIVAEDSQFPEVAAVVARHAALARFPLRHVRHADDGRKCRS